MRKFHEHFEINFISLSFDVLMCWYATASSLLTAHSDWQRVAEISYANLFVIRRFVPVVS